LFVFVLCIVFCTNCAFCFLSGAAATAGSWGGGGGGSGAVIACSDGAGRTTGAGVGFGSGLGLGTGFLTTGRVLGGAGTGAGTGAGGCTGGGAGCGVMKWTSTSLVTMGVGGRSKPLCKAWKKPRCKRITSASGPKRFVYDHGITEIPCVENGNVAFIPESNRHPVWLEWCR